MLDKRGAAHFEMIISFIFFVTFVFFLFVVLKPYDTQTLSGAVVTGLYDSFEKEVRTNLTDVFLKTNENATNCFYVDFPDQIFIYKLTETIVKDVGDVDIDSGVESGNLNINDPNNKTFYKVAISPDFNDENIGGCQELTDYEIGPPVERAVISYSSLEEMSSKYYGNYSLLRSELKIPEIRDFAIVSDDLPEIDMRRPIPDSGEVVANEYIEEVLYSDGRVINAKFTLMVW